MRECNHDPQNLSGAISLSRGEWAFKILSIIRAALYAVARLSNRYRTNRKRWMKFFIEAFFQGWDPKPAYPVYEGSFILPGLLAEAQLSTATIFLTARTLERAE